MKSCPDRHILALALLAACANDHHGAMQLDDQPSDAASAATIDTSGQSVDGPRDASVVPTFDATPPADAATPTDAALPDVTATATPDAGPERPVCDEVLELRAHGGQTPNDVTPFTPAADTDLLERFYFAPNWTTDLHLIGVEPLPDNALSRDSMLFLKPSSIEHPGSHYPNSGLASDDVRDLLAAWSSDALSLPIPNDVGIRVAKGEQVRLILEIHYAAGSATTNRADRSGVRLCLSRTLRAKEATLHRLGTEIIVHDPDKPGGTYATSGRCTPAKASHLVGYVPRMRRYGRHMRLVGQRNGMDYPVFDRPFSIDNKQFVTLPSEVMVQQGDVLTTTCTYDASQSIYYGPHETDEECYALVLAWPAGSLINRAHPGFRW